MGRFTLFLFILSATWCVAVTTARAETQYVTDQLEITLRAGESTRYKILRMLPSGTPLEVLGVSQKTDYARVRTPDGTLGYVLASQIQAEPSARNRITDMETRLAELQRQPDTLAAQLATLQSEHATLTETSQKLLQDKQRLEQELATIRHASSNVLDISNDRDRLRIQVSELTREHANLLQENRDLSNQTNQQWFMIGAGVLGGGVIIGLILPHLRFRRRRSSWGSF